MSAGAVEVGVAYLQVVTSMEGIQGEISGKVGPAADAAGTKAGKSMGEKFGPPLIAGAALAFAGVVAAGKGLYDVGATFDDVADTIRVGTGATGAELEGLVGIAKGVGSDIPAEFSAIGPVVADLNTRLGLSGDTLRVVASQYLEAGRILGQDVDIQKTSAAFSAFGVAGADVEDAMDSLFRVSQSTGVGMNELAGSVQRNAPAMQQLGYSFGETAALAGVLDKAGLDSNRTMAAMGKGLVTLAKQGEAPQEAFKRVSGEIKTLADQGKQAESLDLAAKLFGTKGAPAMVKALQDGTLSAEGLQKALDGTGDRILDVGAETADAAENWTMLKNNVLLALEPLGSAVFGAVGEAVGKAIPYVAQLASWFGQVSTDMGPVVSQGQSLAATFGAQVQPILQRVGAWIQTSFMPAWQQLSAQIAAAVAVAVPIIQQFVAGMMERLAPLLPVVQQIFGAIGEIIVSVMGIVGAIIAQVTSVTSAIWATWGGTIMDVVAAAFSIVANTIAGALNLVSGLIRAALAAINGDWSGAWNILKETVGKVWDNVQSAVQAGVSAVGSIIGTLWGVISGALSGLADRMYSAGTELMDRLAQGIRDTISRATSAIADAARAVAGFVPGSPVREGPLTSFNDGRAGRLLGDMLADGMRSAAGAVDRGAAAMVGGVAVEPAGLGYAPGVSASDIRAALSGMAVDIDNGRLFFRRELTAATSQAGRTARRGTL